MKKVMIAAIFIFLSSIFFHISSASAEVPIDYKQIKRMNTQLKSLHKAGVLIHRKYDFNNLSNVRACVDKNSGLREKAKLLQKQARDIGSMAYRVPLTLASDAAFSCVYCGGSGSECKDIMPEILKVEGMLKESGR